MIKGPVTGGFAVGSHKAILPLPRFRSVLPEPVYSVPATVVGEGDAREQEREKEREDDEEAE